MRAKAKAKLTRIGCRIGWRLGVRWYCLTERASESHGHPVEPAGSCEEIAKRLSFGNAYKPDPWNGKLDIMRHPRRIQRWIDEGKPVGDCLPVDTLVLRGDGELVPLKDLVEGDTIHDGASWVSVVRVWEKTTKPVIRLSLNNGCEVLASPEHRMFISDGRTVRADWLREGDMLLQPSTDFAPGSSSLPEDDAVLLGTYVTEGWAEEKSGRLGFSGIENGKGLREQIVEIAERYGWHAYESERYVRVSVPEGHLLWGAVARMGERALGKRLPTCAYEADTAALLFDTMMRADGGLQGRPGSKGTPVFSSTSKTLTLQMRVLARMLGRSAHLRLVHDHGGAGENPIYRLTMRERGSDRRKAARIVKVEEVGSMECMDITTSSGRIWLPESDVVVHNCDEHAAYWCACLLKSGLVDNVWMGTLQMQAPDGTISGHAVSVFDRPGTGSLWTADYDVPVSIGTDRWGWVDVYCQRYGAKPVFATLAKVIRLDADDLIVMRPEAARGYR